MWVNCDHKGNYVWKLSKSKRSCWEVLNLVLVSERVVSKFAFVVFVCAFEHLLEWLIYFCVFRLPKGIILLIGIDMLLMEIIGLLMALSVNEWY